jgi:hypothetical protein
LQYNHDNVKYNLNPEYYTPIKRQNKNHSPPNYQMFNPILFELSDKSNSNSPQSRKNENKQKYLEKLK